MENEYHLDTINGVEDHLHCLYSLQPKQTISKVVKDIKGASSHWVNANNLITEYFNWQDGYAAFSVSYKNVPFLRKYIYEQEKHHTKISFEDEIKKLREDGII